MNNLYTVASPLEQFETSGLLGLYAPIFGYNLTITNLGLYVILVLVLFLGLQVLAVNSRVHNASGQSTGSVLIVPSR
jgi:hypothetical protein